jgi:hypothetical protein
MIKCEICGKQFSLKGIGTHIWRSHGDGKKHDPNRGFKDGTRTTWNRGLSKNDSDSLLNASTKLSETLKMKVESGTYTPIKWSDEFRERHSSRMSKSNPGGKSKWFEFEKGDGEKVKLQGTWEVRFARILEKMDPDWIKPSLYSNDHSFKWNDGVEHTYTPDFWSPKLQTYFEVKGYWWGNDKEKMNLVQSQNSNLKIVIIQKKDLESYEKVWS